MLLIVFELCSYSVAHDDDIKENLIFYLSIYLSTMTIKSCVYDAQ